MYHIAQKIRKTVELISKTVETSFDQDSNVLTVSCKTIPKNMIGTIFANTGLYPDEIKTVTKIVWNKEKLVDVEQQVFNMIYKLSGDFNIVEDIVITNIVQLKSVIGQLTGKTVTVVQSGNLTKGVIKSNIFNSVVDVCGTNSNVLVTINIKDRESDSPELFQYFDFTTCVVTLFKGTSFHLRIDRFICTNNEPSQCLHIMCK